jgi:hypothetical protein
MFEPLKERLVERKLAALNEMQKEVRRVTDEIVEETRVAIRDEGCLWVRVRTTPGEKVKVYHPDFAPSGKAPAPGNSKVMPEWQAEALGLDRCSFCCGWGAAEYWTAARGLGLA